MSVHNNGGLSPVQYQIAKHVAAGANYPTIAKLLGKNSRIVRHHADVAARKVLPHSKLPTMRRLTLWWERRKG